jgi:hypothetical protein
MKPERSSATLLGITQAKAKMFEYRVPEAFHVKVARDPSLLLALTVGILGDAAALVNQGRPDEDLQELRESLRFCARYFDAYVNSRLANPLREYLLLLGAAAYYLCDLPGSATVLADRLPGDVDLAAAGLENALLWLLRGRYSQILPLRDAKYNDFLLSLVRGLRSFASTGEGRDSVDATLTALRARTYERGSAAELLFGDAVCAMARRRLKHSTWSCLPAFSLLPLEQWRAVLSKRGFMSELWPAQRLLGNKGVFSGRSAVVQMPTSAGKSRGTEVIIRSAFLADRASLAVIVAPFRALCHEISDGLIRAFRGENVTIDEFTDVTQVDFDFAALLTRRSVIVVTPEKLLYVLRHNPELAQTIGLVIYDEGHQFDSGRRGVTYELLLTSLRSVLPEGVQTVLISAVISNAETIGSWVLGPQPNIVTGANLLPTDRAIAFASWTDALGRLEFVDSENPNTGAFFVPRILEAYRLRRRPRERIDRFFSDRTHSPSVALALGLRLAPGGTVALFCGTKATVAKLCSVLVDAYDRGLQVDSPATAANVVPGATQEIERVTRLLELNLGPDALATRAARLGVFTHHGNTPHGVRLAVEYALKHGLGRFVICTSTLAQGVNLPIRYLVVTTIYQGRERIKVRDFHNLIGRAGRSGMHTEGSVIFGDPEVFDRRMNPRENWTWREVVNLLQSRNTEPCASSLLSALLPLRSDDGRLELPIDPLVLARDHAADPFGLVQRRATALAGDRYTRAQLELQLRDRQEVFFAIESFLMAYADQAALDNPNAVRALAEGTLAYHLASAAQRGQLLDLFEALSRNVSSKVYEAEKRALFGRTLFGVDEALALEAWVVENLLELRLAGSDEELLDAIWPAILRFSRNSLLQRLRPQSIIRGLAGHWLAGQPFLGLHVSLTSAGARIGDGTHARVPTEETTVELGENAFGYDAALILGAVAEMAAVTSMDDIEFIERMQQFQKLFKYGLPSNTAVLLFEVGFADRVIAQALAQLIGVQQTREDTVQGLTAHREAVAAYLADLPSVYLDVFERVLPS